MIVVDTSALMAIVLDEADADRCIAALTAAADILISAGTVAEALIVASRRGVHDDMARLISGLGFQIIAVTAATAERIGRAYRVWGKGVHPASLNFGDCFAYDVAKEHGCPLLFVGGDFSKTDLESVL
jgi:ribonuclease VapC